MYIHERDGWPKFDWNQAVLTPVLTALRLRQGRFLGRMEALGFALQKTAELESRTIEVLKTSEIEGEILAENKIRSSIARRLGLDIAGLVPSDRRVDGIVEVTLDATTRYAEPLTAERLFRWHAALLPGRDDITIGAWRTDKQGPMQVVSDSLSNPKVHYEAPAAARLEADMGAFLDWDARETTLDPILKAAVSHLWFVLIHPFDDGNGRIARAIADRALARSENSPRRFYSMSAQIRVDRGEYYRELEMTGKGDLDITNWLRWFLGCLDRAFDGAENSLAVVLRKDAFWKTRGGEALNPRQSLILNMLLDEFKGKMTTKKWAVLAKCSHDTALRDIQDLVTRKVLVQDEAGGRSTSYSLAPFGA